MKQTRRGLLVLMVLLAVVISLCVLPAHAANDTAKLILTPIEAMPNEQFKTTLCVAEGSEIVDFQIQLLYDTDVVRLVSAKASKDVDGDVVVNSGEQGVLKINYTLTSENTSEQMPIVDLVFATDEEIGVGGYEFLKENTAAAKSADRMVGTDLISVPLECDFSALNIYGSGDVDLNGNVEIRDVTRLRQYLAKIVTLTDYQLRMADAYYDEDVNVRDAVYIQQKLAEFDVQLGSRANIRFYDADGNLYATKSVVIGGELTKVPAVPERTGYSNGVWSASASEFVEANLSAVSKDVELYAFYSDAPIIGDDEYEITYNLYDNDAYLERVGVPNPNPGKYSSDTGLVLDEPVVAGYKFEGWYDGQGDNAKRMTEIPKDTTGKLTLYARWTAIEYAINYECNMGNIPAGTYKVNQNTTLTVPTSEIVPAMANYIFLGWTNEDGDLVKTIPAGTTGNQTFTSNWTSRRNMVKPVSKLGDPIICEDEENGSIVFLYELGTIENVPLYEINRYESLYGTQIVVSTEKTSTVSEEALSHYSTVIQQATTQAQTWTLSEDWNTTTNVNETFAHEHGWDQETANKLAKTSSNTFSLTKDQGGSIGVTKTDTTAAKLTGEQSHEDQITTETGQNFDLSVDWNYGREKKKEGGWNLGASLGTDESGKGSIGLNGGSSLLKKWGIALGADYGNYIKNTDKTTDGWKNTVELSGEHSRELTGEANWNTSASFNASNSVTQEQSFKQAIHDVISEERSYGKSYSTGGERSEERDYSETNGQSDEYATTLTYFKSEVTSEAATFTTNGANQGSYRTICAGTAHVFGLVGYDVASNSYYTVTFSVMDDATKVALDYSYDGTFTDYENGVMPFEVPIFVRDYVGDRVAKTNGVIVNKDGLVTGYNGTDSIVFVPAYDRRDNGDGTYSSIRITGISENAFKGNTNIRGVVLSDNITEIPANAFAGCSALEGIFCPGVTSIGDNAFAGCTSLAGFDLTERITSLGSNAFENVSEVLVVAPTKDVALAAVASGAKNITLNIASVTDDLSGTIFTAPDTADSFTLLGGGKTYSNIKVISDAKTTKLNRIEFADCSGVPIQLSSDTLNLEMVTVESPRHAMLLKADNTNVVLYGESFIVSGNGEGIVCRNLNVTTPEKITIATSLDVQNDIMACGSVQDEKNVLFCSGSVKPLTEEQYARYLRGAAEITFDANGGSVEAAGKTVYYGENVGELPVPTREGCEFMGWFTEDGTIVTAETAYDFADDVTLKAHWKSGWVLASNLPSDGSVTNTKWTYDLATRTTSNSSTPPAGYSQYKDPTWVWGAWGAWSGWSRSAPNPGASDSREVQSQWIPAITHTEWNYSRYNEYNYATAGRRGWNGPTQGNWGGHYCQYLEYRGWSTTRLSATGSDSGYTIYDGNWYNEDSRTVTDTAGYTQYRYRDRSKIWTYYYEMIELKESATEVLPSDTISNVQKWVQYVVQ